jgi:hypothetical protein
LAADPPNSSIATSRVALKQFLMVSSLLQVYDKYQRSMTALETAKPSLGGSKLDCISTGKFLAKTTDF